MKCHPWIAVFAGVLAVGALAGCSPAAEVPATPAVATPAVVAQPVVAKAPEPAPAVPVALTDEQRDSLLFLRLMSSMSAATVVSSVECFLEGCEPKANYDSAAIIKLVGETRAQTVASYKTAIAAAAGHEGLAAALKVALNRTTKILDTAMMDPAESKAEWKARHAQMRSDLDDALSLVSTEVDLAP